MIGCGKTASVIAGKISRFGYWQVRGIAVDEIARPYHRKRGSEIGTDKRCALGFFSKGHDFRLWEIRLFVLAIGDIVLPVFVIAAHATIAVAVQVKECDCAIP
ncbi:hypothetical protein D3C80_1070260 [compost metagenome]